MQNTDPERLFAKLIVKRPKNRIFEYIKIVYFSNDIAFTNEK
jgi:hypothetical protein